MCINKIIKLVNCGPTFALLFLLSSVYNANADVFIPFEQTIADQYNMPSSSIQEVEEVTEPVAVVSFEQTIEDQYNSPYALTEIQVKDVSEEVFDYSLYDPNEEKNRKTFEFHQKLDKNLFKPLARTYRDVVPEGGRKAIKNFLHNLETPTVLINDVLQGEQERAGTTVNRFVINTTVGFLGFGDPATDLGYDRHSEDFAQTLATYGVESGPYSYSPIFGPTTSRHTTGRVIDFLTHPLTWYFTDQDATVGLTYGATRVVSTRENLLDALEDVEMDSTDYYVSIRNMYRQMRENQINNGLFGDDPSQFSIDTSIDLNLVF